jgi:hypothetical protein
VSEAEQDNPPGAVPDEVLAGLNDLLQLDHDAMGSYEIAAEKLENRQHAVQIEGFKRDHERHIRDLNEVILSLGGVPLNEPHVTAPLKEGIQRLAAAGGDTTLLTAWRTNELHVTTKYDSYARKAVHWPPEAKRVIDRNALDEERHYQWVVSVLGGSDPEVHAANRLREELGRAKLRTAGAGERLRQITSVARVRAAAGLEEAAERLGRISEARTDLDGERGPAAEGARRLARGFDATAEYLRSSAESGLQKSVEETVRANPVRNLILIFAAGFVAGRILR